MNKWLTIVLLLPGSLLAQNSITPFMGINSTRMSTTDKYKAGGNYPIIGVEIEAQFKTRDYKPLSLSLVSGVSYLNNGFKNSSIISIPVYNYYSNETTDLQMRYLQVPLVLRLNWHPFPLVEDWKIFIGAGISMNHLLQARLTESAIEVPSVFGILAPVVNFNYDSQDVTALGKKYAVFERFEFGMKFKRIMFTYRLSLAAQDLYFTGLEKVWFVPANRSLYLAAEKSKGYTKEKYSEFVIGWRFYKH